MHRTSAKAWLLTLLSGAALAGLFDAGLLLRGERAFSLNSHPAQRGIPIYPVRTAESDLAVSGRISGVPAGATGYVRYADLSSLPLTSVTIEPDEDFKVPVRVTGVPLEVLARALDVSPGSDLISATCTDDYQGHYPADYLAEHHPLLGLTVDRQRASEWAKRTGQYDPGPYFITHAHFVPAFKVLSHADWPQVPTNVARLDFGTAAETYGAIAPRGTYAENSPQEQGFTIARQNCFRCHNQGQYGGTKAGRTWMTLSTWAREQPSYFQDYVHDPKQFEPRAKMPGNPQYDKATLEALTAYFRTFTETGRY
jgi:mono/diheme cytochrome c family protein